MLEFKGGSNVKKLAMLFLIFSALTYGFQAEVVGIHFSPKGGCTDAIVQQIDEAQKEIKIMIYSFTSDAIAQALLQALIRNVAVEIIIDEGNDKSRYSQTNLLRQNGIKVYIDARETIHHNKVIIIDQEIVITGSFNFSKAAEQKNAENLIILKSAELATIYLVNYELHKEHSYLVETQNIEQIREKILFDIQEEQSSTQTELNDSATSEATAVRE